MESDQLGAEHADGRAALPTDAATLVRYMVAGATAGPHASLSVFASGCAVHSVAAHLLARARAGVQSGGNGCPAYGLGTAQGEGADAGGNDGDGGCAEDSAHAGAGAQGQSAAAASAGASGSGATRVVASAAEDSERASLPGGSSAGLLLCIGETESDRHAVKCEFVRLFGASSAASAVRFPVEVTADYTGEHRAVMYSRSSASMFVTTRILVVDLLTGRLKPSQVRRVVVMNAHRLQDVSPEAFAVRLIREGNASTHICGLSATPRSLKNTSRVEQVAGLLGAPRLVLWPRFQVDVARVLDARPPQVVELQQPLTAAMLAVQRGIVQAMEHCLKELATSTELDVTGLTVEHGLLAPIDELVKRQKGTVWHLLPRRLKLILGDLSTLRTIATLLLTHDAATFLAYLVGLRESEGQRSVWLSLDIARSVFDSAQRRVATKSGGSGAEVICLEPLPKWGLLRDVLGEVAAEHDLEEEVPVLVVVRDQGTALQLESVLTEGAEQFMQRAYARLKSRPVRAAGKPKKRKARGGEGGGGGTAGTGASTGADSSSAATPAAVRASAAQVIGAAGTAGTGGSEGSCRPGGMAEGESYHSVLVQGASGGGGGKGAPPPCRVFFHATQDGPCISPLWDLRPRAVVVYDIHAQVIRELETFCAGGGPGRDVLKCFLLMYEESIEAQQFVSSVQEEKSAFEGKRGGNASAGVLTSAVPQFRCVSEHEVPRCCADPADRARSLKASSLRSRCSAKRTA